MIATVVFSLLFAQAPARSLFLLADHSQLILVYK